MLVMHQVAAKMDKLLCLIYNYGVGWVNLETREGEEKCTIQANTSKRPIPCIPVVGLIKKSKLI